jgi:Putative polyhydroxyalkanoic acid system protein (PHA_gran_rgn)
MMKYDGRGFGEAMSKPLIVCVPHNLGQEEAVRRLKAKLAVARAEIEKMATIQEERWGDNNVQFRLSALGYVASGTVDVTNDHVRFEINLPRILLPLADKFESEIRRQSNLTLEESK